MGRLHNATWNLKNDDRNLEMIALLQKNGFFLYASNEEKQTLRGIHSSHPFTES